MNKGLVLALFILINACSKKTETAPENVYINETAKDFKVPQDLFSIVQKKYPDSQYIFSPLIVRLHNETGSVMNAETFDIHFPSGGGTLDYSKYIFRQGSFYLSFPKEQFDEKTTIEHVFYISNAPKVDLHKNKVGLGCGQWTDLYNHFFDFQKKNFLKLNTTDLRHLYVTAGQYIFVMKKEKNILISHLDITDTTQEDKLCHKIFSIK